MQEIKNKQGTYEHILHAQRGFPRWMNWLSKKWLTSLLLVFIDCAQDISLGSDVSVEDGLQYYLLEIS